MKILNNEGVAQSKGNDDACGGGGDAMPQREPG
jgi:hypothetical protein